MLLLPIIFSNEKETGVVVAWDSSRNTISRVGGREHLRPRDAAGEHQ